MRCGGAYSHAIHLHVKFLVQKCFLFEHLFEMCLLEICTVELGKRTQIVVESHECSRSKAAAVFVDPLIKLEIGGESTGTSL